MKNRPTSWSAAAGPLNKIEFPFGHQLRSQSPVQHGDRCRLWAPQMRRERALERALGSRRGAPLPHTSHFRVVS
jgi:hypothetical protein